MAKKKAAKNERAEAGSGERHDKHDEKDKGERHDKHAPKGEVSDNEGASDSTD